MVSCRNRRIGGHSLKTQTPFHLIGTLETPERYMTEKATTPHRVMTLQELELHLWEAADILRGSIDSADYKHYIFGLLFFKRLSDVWEEEYEARMAKFNNKKIARKLNEHRFHIPKNAFWQDVRQSSKNIGAHLNRAFREIEHANSKLHGVFQDVDFNNKERFPDSILERLLKHFDTLRLRHEDVPADVLGNAYEYLIAKFANDTGKKGGEFYTPKEVVRLIVECIQPQKGMSIYDPTCGSGGMLLESYYYLERNKQDPKSLHLYGQEKNLNTWAICQMNLFLHDIDDTHIERGDTIREPKHLIGSKTLQTFDCVIANPPFSLANWGHDFWSEGDKFGRDKYACPPKSYGDLAFVQHMVASLNAKGKLGVVLPHGILFRGGTEGKIRQGLLEDDLIEGIIGLAPNLFYGTSIPACLLIINKKKIKEHKNKVIFIQGIEHFVENKHQNNLSEKNVQTLAQGFLRYKDKEHFSRVVDLSEIRQNDFNLNIANYLQHSKDAEKINIRAELISLKALLVAEDKAEKKMLSFMKELGYDP